MVVGGAVTATAMSPEAIPSGRMSISLRNTAKRVGCDSALMGEERRVVIGRGPYGSS